MARSLISSLFTFKCPQCRTGGLYFKPWSVDTAYKMPDRCPHCDMNYLPEPGYYYGAMFLGYILTGFLFLGWALFAVFALKMTVAKTFIILIVFALLTHNFFFRFSRSLWLHMMIRFQPKKAKK